MMDDIQDIADFYNNNPQIEHNRLIINQLEFDLTWRFLDLFLPPCGNILEIGAATCRYTLGLLERGYSVTAVDLSFANLKIGKNFLHETGSQNNVQFIVADARDLSIVIQNDYDAVLLMGPLYHLIYEDDRLTALKEAFNRMKIGGIIISSFISRYGIWGEFLKHKPEFIEDQDEIKELLSTGTDHNDWPRRGFRGYFAKPTEVSPLHESIGFETIKVVGVEPCISADDDSYNKLIGHRRKLFLDLFYRLSDEPSIIGASRHLLYIGKKNKIKEINLLSIKVAVILIKKLMLLTLC